MRVGLAGVGSWGRNVSKALDKIGADHCVYDPAFPNMIRSYEDLLGFCEAVCIATPAETHWELALKSLQAGKHTFVEKPMCLHANEARHLVETAQQFDVVLMVGHSMLYSPGFVHLKKLIDAGGLGDIISITAERTNLGKVRTTENAAWSLAPHDISMIVALLGCPNTVQAQGIRYSSAGIEDTVHINLGYDNALAHIHVSWMHPLKTRRLTVVGSEKMCVFDDMAADKIAVYDRGINVAVEDYRTVRYGDITYPWLDATQPLENELRHFLACCEHGGRPISDGKQGLQVVTILEAVDRSLALGGEPVAI